MLVEDFSISPKGGRKGGGEEKKEEKGEGKKGRKGRPLTSPLSIECNRQYWRKYYICMTTMVAVLLQDSMRGSEVQIWWL